MLIGRRDERTSNYPDIDLSPMDAHNSVSRIHAEIRRVTDGFVIEDKGSLNGTRVNEALLKPNVPAKLKAGDLCRFGNVKMRFTGEKLEAV
jgi:pSer/pThr/pTyr-binding forkhead associated (FHA) protein